MNRPPASLFTLSLRPDLPAPVETSKPTPVPDDLDVALAFFSKVTIAETKETAVKGLKDQPTVNVTRDPRTAPATFTVDVTGGRVWHHI